MPKFELIVYENSHYMDESEAMHIPNIGTYEEAHEMAVQRVVGSLESLWQEGMTPKALLASYKLWGEDPTIVPEPDPQNAFSAWTLAESVAEQICWRGMLRNVNPQGSS